MNNNNLNDDDKDIDLLNIINNKKAQVITLNIEIENLEAQYKNSLAYQCRIRLRELTSGKYWYNEKLDHLIHGYCDKFKISDRFYYVRPNTYSTQRIGWQEGLDMMNGYKEISKETWSKIFKELEELYKEQERERKKLDNKYNEVVKTKRKEIILNSENG